MMLLKKGIIMQLSATLEVKCDKIILTVVDEQTFQHFVAEDNIYDDDEMDDDNVMS